MISKNLKLNVITLFLIPCLLYILLLLPVVYGSLDRVFLLEDNYPGYTRIIAKAAVEYPEKSELESTLADDEEVDKSLFTHKVINVNKDGFGLVAPNDVNFLLKLISHTEPNIKELTLRFTDATAIQIPVANKSEAVYGSVDNKGNITEIIKEIDLSVPIQKQVDGITNITENWRRDGKKTYYYKYCYDAEGKGVADSSGIAGYEIEYEYANIISVLLSKKNGNQVFYKTLGTDGNPVANSNGYAIVRSEYDKDNLINESFYDADDNLVMRTDRNYASVSFEYDDSGNCISETYYDQDGEPVVAFKQFASIRRQYNDNRHITREEYYGADLKPLLLSTGEAITERGYDEAGNLDEERFYGESGQPIITSRGYHKVLRQYDEKDQIVHEEYYGIDGKPILISGGYASVDYAYDDDGNRTSFIYYDCSNNLTLTSWNYAKLTRGYDKNGQVVREEYYGTDLKPLVQAAGYVAVNNEYAINGSIISKSYIGEDGEQIVRTDGYSKAVWSLDDNGSTWNVNFKDADGRDVSLDGKNLIKDFKPGADGWSQWFTPENNRTNSCFELGTTNLGDKQDGDVYTCTVEVEFKDVSVTEGSTFKFRTQGSQDKKWYTGNVWDSSLVNLEEAPADGIYKYESTVAVTGEMVDVSIFVVGFRCDNWASGSFRVRNVKIEKGDHATAWSPGI
ncbi:MAG: hypothetical protein K6G84_10495 [Lachnospiraceae bacterium]|nr:hypothetical protein [Lachnospiraceae bacterium]